MGTRTQFDVEDAVALQGTLDTFALPDVLRLLAATKKSGRLQITGPRGAGSIWVAGGDVTAVVVDHAPLAVDLVEAMFELLRFEHGSFSFDADAAPNVGQTSDVEPLLEGAEALLAEWREIAAVVPSLTSWVTMRLDLPDETVSVDRAAWTTLVAVGSGATVATIGEALGLGELPVSRAVRGLVELGVVVIEERAAEPVVEPDAESEPPDTDAAARHDGAVESADQPLGDTEPAAGGSEPVEEGPDIDEVPASGSIPGPKARRARPKQLRVSDSSQPDVFVPLDLSAMQQPRSYDSEEAPESDDDLTARFPGLAVPSTEVADDAAPADEEADVDEAAAGDHDADGDETLNRGLLLKFLSSVKS